LLKQKQQHLIESNPEGIKTVTLEIEEAIVKINKLEKERSKLLDNFISSRLTRPAKDAFSWQKMFPDDTVPEKDLIMAFRSQERVKGQLRAILTKVQKIQDTNRLLIQQGRDVLQSCMECLITQVTTENYDEKGLPKKEIDTSQGFLDQTI
ncbi:MAG: flagellar export chaperone FlgN, partial [bacterium]